MWQRPARSIGRVSAEILERRMMLTLAGNSLFPADNPWNHPITDTPVAGNSATLVDYVGADSPLHPDFGTTYQGAENGIPYSVVNSSQATVPIDVDTYPVESDLDPVPIPADAQIEGEAPGGAADFISLPSYALFNISNASNYTWELDPANPAALVDPLSLTPEAASTWYAASFTINLNITDGKAHRIAIYVTDYEDLQRSERVDIINAANSQVLASRNISSFVNGEYLIVDLTGNVQLKFTDTSSTGVDAVLSGIFFGAPGLPTIPDSTSANASLVSTDTLTHGNWPGTYGSDGYSLAPLEDDGDRHLIVYDTSNQTDYELYDVYRPSEESDGQWHAASEAVWNMSVDTFRTPGFTSADAAGLPILSGLVRSDEVLTQGAITHALRMTVGATYDEYIYPASHHTNNTNPNQPKMGQRFRLDPDFDISSFSPADQVILQALKTYGAIVADNGSPWFISGAPSDLWSDDDLHNLNQVSGSDFQAVDLTPVVSAVDPASALTGGSTSITLHGINFTGVAGQIAVYFGSVAGTNLNVIDDNTLTVTAPANAGQSTVDVTVVTPYGTSVISAGDKFARIPTATTWKTSVWGDWNNPANWTNGIPSSISTEADFLTANQSGLTVSSSVAVTAGVVRIDSPMSFTLAGSGSLTLGDSGTPGLIYIQAGAVSLNLPLTIAGADYLSVYGSSAVSLNSALAFSSAASLGLSIAGNSRFTLPDHSGNGPQVLQLSELAVTSGGTLDLTSHDLVIQTGNLATITALISQGFNVSAGGTWTGTGIISSAAAGDTAHLTALGIILNSSDGTHPLYGNATLLGTFDGLTPSATSVLAKYTWYGDANLDGKVDGSDYARIDNGSINGLTGWYNGDFNFDGVIDGSDYTLIDNTFNTQGARITAQLADPQKAHAARRVFAGNSPITSSSIDSWMSNSTKKRSRALAGSFFGNTVLPGELLF